MNSYQAKQIPLTQILEREGFTVCDTTAGGNQFWYSPNPFRDERTPSFNVNPAKNVWHDMGTGKGGNVLDFVMEYAQTDFRGALQWLSDRQAGHTYPKHKVEPVAPLKTDSRPRYEIQSIKPLNNTALLNHLESRRISATMAKAHLQEAYYRDNERGKTFFGLCLTNYSGGQEIKNSYVKTCIGHKDFTFIPGSTGSAQVQVFEGMTDFLTFLEMNRQQRPKDACIILNGLTMAEKAAAFIADLHQERPRQVMLWLDNEPEGSTARIAVETARQHFAAHAYPVYSLSHHYSQVKDLNDYWKAGNPPLVPAPRLVAPGPHQQQQLNRRQQDNQLGLLS